MCTCYFINVHFAYNSIDLTFHPSLNNSATQRRRKKTKPSMISTLLLLLCISDLCVIVGLLALFSLPHLWPWYQRCWPRVAPWLIPLSQIALLTSEYTTVLISMERYVRIVYTCNLKICKFFNEDNFK